MTSYHHSFMIHGNVLEDLALFSKISNVHHRSRKDDITKVGNNIRVNCYFNE